MPNEPFELKQQCNIHVLLRQKERGSLKHFQAPRTFTNSSHSEVPRKKMCMKFPAFNGPEAFETTLDSLTSRKLPALMYERPFDTSGYDKIFASAWVSPFEVLAGTKCNKLLLFNTINGKTVEIPVPITLAPVSPSEKIPCTGIHSLSINPSKTLIAVGSDKTAEYLQIFSFPDFAPVGLLKGHNDLVFSTMWIDDWTLVSGSRDCTIKTWKLKQDETLGTDVTSENPRVQIYYPESSEKAHDGKVRDVKYDHNTQKLASLSSDGFLKLWDVNQFQVSSLSAIPLHYTNELVCMGYDPVNRVYAVGSQAHISIIDPRSNSIVNTVESLDAGWGVRSLDVCNELVTIGGGFGKITFFDIRANAYMEWKSVNRSENNGFGPKPLAKSFSSVQQMQPDTNSLESSKGWIKPNSEFFDQSYSHGLRNAIYTLSYDPTRSKLFSAGGPLQVNFTGSYAALW